MYEIREINDADFESVVTSDNIVVVDFFAPWCGPCRKISGIVAEIASEFENSVDVVKLNIDENLQTAKKYTISSIPTILVFKNGEPCERLVGMISKSALKDVVAKTLL